MKIRIINQSGHPLPEYATPYSAGMDIRAALKEPMTLRPHARQLIPTGLSIELPEGYEAQIRPRSGLAYRYGVTVLNAPGTIDADYRGEIKVLLINHGDHDFQIQDGDRIAQMIVTRHKRVNWELTDKLSETLRGEKGYGSTGKK